MQNVKTITMKERETLQRMSATLIELGTMLDQASDASEIDKQPLIADEIVTDIGVSIDDLVKRIQSRTPMVANAFIGFIEKLQDAVDSRDRFAQTLRNVSELAAAVIRDVVLPLVR